MFRGMKADEAMEEAAVLLGDVEIGDVFCSNKDMTARVGLFVWMIIDIEKDNNNIWYVSHAGTVHRHADSSYQSWFKRTTWYTNGYCLINDSKG